MKYALVTGSTRGIGKQIAKDLLKSGCYVILNYSYSEEAAKSASLELSRISSNFTILKGDLSNIENLNIFITAVKNITCSLDYLILNAYATERVGFKETSYDMWNKIMNVNLTIPFFLVQGIQDILNQDGRIIFIGSTMGMHPHSRSVPYGVSKAGVHMLSNCLVKHFCDRRITVNAIVPGFVNTSTHDDKHPDHIKRIKEKISLGRFGEVEEISKACLSLIDNGYITGQEIVVDGGYNYR